MVQSEQHQSEHHVIYRLMAGGGGVQANMEETDRE